LIRLVRVNLGIWEKLTKLVVFLLFVLGVVAVFIWYLPLIRQNERMRQDIARLDGKIKAAVEYGKSLRSSVDGLRNDPRTIERYARANLQYAKPGETVIRFEPPRRQGR
jgi:cell division protein FtsB